jgi:DNA modification methylase
MVRSTSRLKSLSAEAVSLAYKTEHGQMLVGKIEDALASPSLINFKGKVNLILTSPPFPLVRKKKYGNETGEQYLRWLADLAPRLAELLTEDGSIVIEVGNAWEESRPEMSTLPLEALLEFKKAAKLYLCQHLICHNPARLPGPAAWVTIKRIRLKDSFTHVWWLSKSAMPKADNKKVLLPYGKDMKALLLSKNYNPGRRPSGHKISETGFLTDHGGSISPNVIDLEGSKGVPNALLKFANTRWDGRYRKYCVENNLELHPARMQNALAAFFIEFLTDEKDMVLDPFGGSNTTGAIAESLKRRWISVEANSTYAEGSKGRFPDHVKS